MDQGKKGKGGLILAIMGGKGGRAKNDEMAEERMETRKIAAQSVLDAIKSEDPEELADAMQTMVESCSMGEY